MIEANKALIKWCDDITSEGQSLSVYWNGGSDSGFFEMKLDGNVIDEQYDETEPIKDRVAEVLGYGGFDGDFTSEGEVFYNRDTKSFQGDDVYSESEFQDKECSIVIIVPNEIWFDRLLVSIESDGCDELLISVQFLVLNGPIIAAHTDFESSSAVHIRNEIRNLLAESEDIESMEQYYSIPVADFKDLGTHRVFAIESVNYWAINYKTNELEISLTEIVEYDTTF